jgi:hypothetical protein
MAMKYKTTHTHAKHTTLKSLAYAHAYYALWLTTCRMMMFSMSHRANTVLHYLYLVWRARAAHDESSQPAT